MNIQERNESWLNFFTPAVIAVAGVLLPTLAAISILLANWFVPLLGEDDVIAFLRVGFISRIIGTILVAFILIPRFNVKVVEYQPVSCPNTLKTVLILCFSAAITDLSYLVFGLVFSVFNFTPESDYEGIHLTTDHLANPFNFLIFLGFVAIVGPIFEEYVYRRTLIPLLEERGMTPFPAVLASSLVFVLIHAPNDLLHGNLPFTISHLWGVFAVSLNLGMVYVLTRNILYSILVHGFMNVLGFLPSIFELMKDQALLMAFELLSWLIFFTGLGVGAYVVWTYFESPRAKWVRIVKEKSAIHIVPGLLGFVGISVVCLTLQTMVDVTFARLISSVQTATITDIMVEGFLLGILFAILMWLATKTEYVSKTMYTKKDT